MYDGRGMLNSTLGAVYNEIPLFFTTQLII